MSKTFFKKITLIILSLVLAWVSFSFLSALYKSNNVDIGIVPSLFIAFMLNLCLTGVFAFIGFGFPTSNLLPKSYYQIKNPKLLSRTYKVIGVPVFRFFLMLLFWGSKKNRKKYFDGTKSGIKNFIYQTKQSEFGHLMAFVAINLSSFLLIFKGYWILLAFTLGINIIGNYYPIILQRHHRIRLSQFTDY